MADLFSDLRSGFRMPDVRMNQGPLPSVAGGPAGSDGTADGRYNFNGNLLDGITPYAYGEAARAGSDRNYQQIPHRIQKIVPPLYLPDLDGKSGKKMMSHAVDQGDVAFIINLEQDKVQHILAADPQMHASDAGLQSLTPFCNIVTVNYMLAGLWRYGNNKKSKWNDIQNAFGMGEVSLFDDTNEYNAEKVCEIMASDDEKDIENREKVMKNLRNLVRFGFLPFGICAGSEHQGGKHETGLAPVVAAVNYVTTMTIDGQNRDLVNVWRPHNLANGDQLIYRIGWQITRSRHTFTLNHYYKDQAQLQIEHGGVSPQLIPDILTPCMRKVRKNEVRNTATFSEFNEWGLLASKEGNADDKHNLQTKLIQKYNYRWFGYWRIGQMMHHRGPHLGGRMMTYDDDMQFLSGGLLQITFAPVWRQCDCRGGDDDGLGGYSFEEKDEHPVVKLQPIMSGKTLKQDVSKNNQLLGKVLATGILIAVQPLNPSHEKQTSEKQIQVDQLDDRTQFYTIEKRSIDELVKKGCLFLHIEMKSDEDADHIDVIMPMDLSLYTAVTYLGSKESKEQLKELITDASASGASTQVDFSGAGGGYIDFVCTSQNLTNCQVKVKMSMSYDTFLWIKQILEKRDKAFTAKMEKDFQLAKNKAAENKADARRAGANSGILSKIRSKSPFKSDKPTQKKQLRVSKTITTHDSTTLDLQAVQEFQDVKHQIQFSATLSSGQTALWTVPVKNICDLIYDEESSSAYESVMFSFILGDGNNFPYKLSMNLSSLMSKQFHVQETFVWADSAVKLTKTDDDGNVSNFTYEMGDIAFSIKYSHSVYAQMTHVCMLLARSVAENDRLQPNFADLPVTGEEIQLCHHSDRMKENNVYFYVGRGLKNEMLSIAWEVFARKIAHGAEKLTILFQRYSTADKKIAENRDLAHWNVIMDLKDMSTKTSNATSLQFTMDFCLPATQNPACTGNVLTRVPQEIPSKFLSLRTDEIGLQVTFHENFPGYLKQQFEQKKKTGQNLVLESSGMGGLFAGFQKLHGQFSSTPAELPAAKQARVAGAASVSSATSVSSVAASGVSKNPSAPTVASASHTPMQTDATAESAKLDAKPDAQKDAKMDTKLDAKLDAKARAAQTMASHVGGVKSARKSKPKSATEEDAMDDA